MSRVVHRAGRVSLPGAKMRRGVVVLGLFLVQESCVCGTVEAPYEPPITPCTEVVEGFAGVGEGRLLTGPQPSTLTLDAELEGSLWLCGVSASVTSSVVRIEGLRRVRYGIFIEGLAVPIALEFADLQEFGRVDIDPLYPGYQYTQSGAEGRLVRFPAYEAGTSTRSAGIRANYSRVDLPRATHLSAISVTGAPTLLSAPLLTSADYFALTDDPDRAATGAVGHPSLERAGTVSLSFFSLAEAFRFEQLETVSELHVRGANELTRLEFPALRAITNQLRIEGCPRLPACEVIRLLEQLTQAPAVVQVDIPLQGVECP